MHWSHGIEVLARFDGREGFNLIRLRGLSLLNQGDQFVWRFKKVERRAYQNYQRK